MKKFMIVLIIILFLGMDVFIGYKLIEAKKNPPQGETADETKDTKETPEETKAQTEAVVNILDESKRFAWMDDEYVLFSQARIASDFANDGLEVGETVSGSYAVYNGIPVSVSLERTSEFVCTLNVNDVVIEFDVSSVGGAALVDLDTSDSYTEIAVMDPGPSGDPVVYFFRYDGTQIICIGSVEGNYSLTSVSSQPVTEAGIWLNQKGRIIGSWQQINFTRPVIPTGYMQVEGNSLNEYRIDLGPVYQNALTVSEDFNGFFKEMEAVPEKLDNGYWTEMSFSDEDKIQITKGSKITIIEYNFDAYTHETFVQLEDGRKGVLYFFTGD